MLYKSTHKLIWQNSTPNPELIKNMNIVEIENSFFPLIWNIKHLIINCETRFLSKVRNKNDDYYHHHYLKLLGILTP